MSEKAAEDYYKIYDLILPRMTQVNHVDNIQNVFRIFCDRWCFQLEQEGDNPIQYRCRLSFKAKKKLLIAKYFCETCFIEADIKPINNQEEMVGDSFYTLREDIRISGPWTDKNSPGDKIIIPDKIPKWLPWQQEIIEAIRRKPDPRLINLVIETKEKSRQDFLSRYLNQNKKALLIPYHDPIGIMRFVLDNKEIECYFIDFPKDISEKDLSKCYTVIEGIKNGYIHAIEKKKYKPPHVWVFLDKITDWSLFSSDRWQVWKFLQ